jgi:hypothetical protein
VRPVRRRERIVDPDIAEPGQFGHESRIVLLFFLVEAGIFQTKDVAVLHRANSLFGGFTDAILGKGHRPPEHLRQCSGNGFQRVLGVAPLGPAEMGQQDHLAALVGQLDDPGRYAFEPGGVGDAAVFHGHVEIDAQQHALALHVDVIEGAE